MFRGVPDDDAAVGTATSMAAARVVTPTATIPFLITRGTLGSPRWRRRRSILSVAGLTDS